MILSALESMYGAAVRVRRGAYDAGLFTRQRARRPVISVGNLEAGGIGKTPFVIALSDMLALRGLRVAVLSRGYGRADEREMVIVSIGDGPRTNAAVGGDEPVLIAQRTAAIVVASADRVHAAEVAVRDLSADVLVLDDGFQHLRLDRDLDLVLLDRSAPLDGGHLLPRGRLRERPSVLERADLLVFVGEPGSQRAESESALPKRPRLDVTVEAEAIEHMGRRHAPSSIAGRRVALLSGIGRPERFEQTVVRLGAEVVHSSVMRDHAAISERELERFLGAARGVDLVITTEKDSVRLGPLRPESLAVLSIRHRIEQGEVDLERALSRVFG